VPSFAIVVMNTWMWGSEDDPRVRRLSRLVASPLGRFLYRWLNASPRWLVPASFAKRERLTAEIHRHYLGPFARRADRTAPWVLGCELHGSSGFFDHLWQRRAQLPVTPALLWGMRDPACDPTQLKRWQEAWPDAPVVTLDDAGHFPQEETPERVTAFIRNAASNRAA
jgi:haloalkane dehalogenase